MNSHSDSESPTESGRDGGSNAKKRLETAAAEPVCRQNLQLLGSMDARRAADAGRRAVCGQRVLIQMRRSSTCQRVENSTSVDAR